MIVLYLSLIAVLTLGCARAAQEDVRIPPVGRDKVPESARVVCDGDGAHVLTPKVEARADGVHISLDNRLGGDADFSVDHPGGGMGWSVPTGDSERVANVPPGTVRVDCYKRSWGKEKALAIDGGTIEVLAGDSGYRSTKLDCPRGKLAGGMGPYSEEEMGGEGDSVELLRRELSDSLREGDVVEIAGNPQRREDRARGPRRRGGRKRPLHAGLGRLARGLDRKLRRVLRGPGLPAHGDSTGARALSSPLRARRRADHEPSAVARHQPPEAGEGSLEVAARRLLHRGAAHQPPQARVPGT